MTNLKNKVLGVFTLFVFLIMSACSDTLNDQKEVSNASTNNKEELAKSIEALEDSLTNVSVSLDAKSYSLELLRLSTQFVDEFPLDSRCAEYSFMGARAASGLGDYDKSIHIMETIKKVYGNYSQLPEVYFLCAFTLDEEMGKKEEARAAYTDLINKFPDDPLSAQAIVLLEQLYMTDEELIEMWSKQEQNQ